MKEQKAAAKRPEWERVLSTKAEAEMRPWEEKGPVTEQMWYNWVAILTFSQNKRHNILKSRNCEERTGLPLGKSQFKWVKMLLNRFFLILKTSSHLKNQKEIPKKNTKGKETPIVPFPGDNLC